MELIIGIIIIIATNSLLSVILLTLLSIYISITWILNGTLFIGIILTIVYAGAIIILIVFVLFILDLNKMDIIKPKQNKYVWLLLLLLLIYNSTETVIYDYGITDIELIAINNYSVNGLLLVIVSILLLLSITGPIYLIL